MLQGIDVSEWNGVIDWQRVKDNVDFAIIRAGYGKNNIDGTCKNNIAGCEKVGLPFGLYWFSYAFSPEMAKAEARYVLDIIGNKRIAYPVYFDFEYDSMEYAHKNGYNLDKASVSAIATAFCEELEKNKFYAGIYANQDYIHRYLTTDVLQKYDLWLASWGDTPGRSVHMWQHSSTGSVPGVNGKVDLNRAFIDFPKIMADNNLNNYNKQDFVCPHNCPHCPHCNV